MKSMVLLDHLGKPQMYMEGGEIVFSRPSTRAIVDLAMKANNENSLYNLGQFVYDERRRQIKRES